MHVPQAIQQALKHAQLFTEIKSVSNLSGGCIHQVMQIDLQDGSKVVAKVNAQDKVGLFEEEADSLRALAGTKTVEVPEPIAVAAFETQAVFLMHHIPQRAYTSAAWRNFGRQLAALHDSDQGTRYGFERDNHIGTSLQPNAWKDDWVKFNAVNRLGYQLALAGDADLLGERESQAIQRLVEKLEQFIPRHPKPALLHGDLWSGNVLPTLHDQVAIIDPACSIGDGAADIAMMQLFGGFPQECFDSYWSHRQVQSDEERVVPLQFRIAVYQLYHVLNHVNIFGRAYVDQAMQIVRKLVGRA